MGSPYHVGDIDELGARYRGNMTIEQLEHEVLSLPLHERARLAERLISSLDEESELEREWQEEAERRLARIEAGETTTRPGEDVLRDARARLEK